MITKAGIYNFALGGQNLRTYLEPGDVVTINGDAETFNAEGSFTDKKQQTVAAYFQAKSKIMEEHLTIRSLYDMEPDSFLIALQAGEEKLQANLAAITLPKAITDRELEAFGFRTKRLNYLYPIYTEKEKATLPEGLKNPLAGIDLTDENKFKTNEAYASLVDTKFSMDLNQDTTGEYEEVFMEKISALPAGNIRNALLYNTMRYMVGPNDKLDGYMDFFKEHSSDKVALADMEEQYEAYQGLMKGNPSPSFDYENHKGGKTKLEELRGKYVYVDVWATWCGPCIGELPSLKAKEEKYHDANVEFVSISIDEVEDNEKWKEMVKNRELSGIQLMADNAWQSSFPKDYKINGIPRFILIDPAGNIVSADAPRPSSDELDEMFAVEGLE